MKFQFDTLTLSLRREEVTIRFSAVNYFWGQMGAGKTSIAQLIDYCLGADIKLTPALQSEFVSATLTLELKRSRLQIERPRDADQVICQWDTGEGATQASIPSRKGDGEVVPGTGVENLSDLIFWLSDVVPPRVRTSKVKQDSDLRRLSIRDLLWYCYLDQDSMDSSFFYLEDGAHIHKQLKSRDVIRYVIGFHDERVAELEAQLDTLKGERTALTASVNGIGRVLKEVGVGSEEQIAGKVANIRARAEAIEREIQQAKVPGGPAATSHSVDRLRVEAVRLASEIERVESAMLDLQKLLDNDLRHLHEMETLSLKVKRSVSAKAILGGVAFESCPRCAQALPERESTLCQVCGQPEQELSQESPDVALVERDIKGRSTELTESIQRHEESLVTQRRQREELVGKKVRVDRERNEASAEHDSAYLSSYLAKEKERAALLQEADGLASLVKLAQAVQKQRDQIASIESREGVIRGQLREAREAAESDAENLDRLRSVYLDCLVRTGVPGISPDDTVEILTRDFFPFMRGMGEAEHQITSFATISSGGKKNLLKACFAVAMHRVAASLKAPLPELLIIDSAMKNISERENRAQFEGFYRMLYELKSGELRNTQMIFIDKEFLGAPEEVDFEVVNRQMRPDGVDTPPLIPYYRGK